MFDDARDNCTHSHYAFSSIDPFLSLLLKKFFFQSLANNELWMSKDDGSREQNGESMDKREINVDDNLTILKANHYFISRNGHRHV